VGDYRFDLPLDQSPTYFNLASHLEQLGWTRTSQAHNTTLHSQHFDFNLHAAQQLEFKHLLSELLLGTHLMPSTFTLDDHNWSAVLPILERYPNIQWILKPSLLNNGQHIKLFTSAEQIMTHFGSRERLGGPHVLQHYINKPDLLRGHKYSIRLFVALTETNAYLYPQGYLNVARLPYHENNFDDLRPHLTNEHLLASETNVHQIPTDRWPVFPHIYPTIQRMVAQTIHVLRQQNPEAFGYSAPKALALFGFDFLMDSTQRIWLLEANHGPCFPTDDAHPLQQHLYQDFWRALIHDVIYPLLGLTLNSIPTRYRFKELAHTH
jgi:tubulin--tyrosine ligase